MTPPETPEGRGTEPAPEVERTATISTSTGAVPPAGEQAAPAEPQQSNGQGDATETTIRPVTAEDLDGAPPPWQRVTTDASYGAGNGYTPSFDDSTRRLTEEETISVARPVVTGTAAPRSLGEQPVALHHNGPPADLGAPARTTVNLGGPTTMLPGSDGQRVGAGAPPSALRRPGRGPRRASLQIKRFDPWSVLKLSLVLSVALFFVWLVAVGALYAVLDGMGVWDKLNGTAVDLFQGGAGGGAEPLISAGRVFGIAAIIGAVNIVLFSALATVGAFVYNVSADLAGGLEVTLAERE